MYTSQDTLEMCSREIEFKSILFSLVYFHAVVIERRKFGPQGWNRSYPFNTGDLTISVYVLFNYLEANAKVPWTDLRYLFGEIMYGGHITDDWDRRLCRTYLEEFMMPEQVSMLFPSLEMTSPHTLGHGRRANKHTVIQSFVAPQIFLGYLAHARAIGTTPFLLPLKGPGYKASYSQNQNEILACSTSHSNYLVGYIGVTLDPNV